MNLRLYDKWRDTWYYDERKLQSTLSPVLNEIRSIKVDGMLYIAGHGRVIKCFPDDFSLPTVIAYASAENDRFPSILLNDD
jgi:LacI family transcriptional regulator